MSADRVVVSFPGDPDYLRLARLVSADAGARVGFDYEEVDDLKLAVSELCGLVATDGGPVTLEFAFQDHSLTVYGSWKGSAQPVGDLTRAIVGVLVDEYSVDVHDGVSDSTFHLRKSARSTP